MNPVPVREFTADLQSGTASELDPHLITGLRAHFGPFEVLQVTDRDLQRFGVDLTLFLPNGEMLFLQVKTREKDYCRNLPSQKKDVLIEYFSSIEGRKLGWIDGYSPVDFLVIVYRDTGRLEIFPWKPLQAAWRRYHPDWLRKYPSRTTRSRGYRGELFTSLSLAVPVGVIRAAIAVVSKASPPFISATK